MVLTVIHPGIQSVLSDNATYSPFKNPSDKPSIAIQNDLHFKIFASVLNSGSLSDQAPSQRMLAPGKLEVWCRDYEEVAFVYVGGAQGAPRAYLGRLGFTLHINSIS